MVAAPTRMRHTASMVDEWAPELQLHEHGGQCRLHLVGVTYGNGHTLQEASNDLVARVFDLAVGVHSGRFRLTTGLGRPDPQVLSFLWETGEIASRGGDIRPRVLGVPAQRQPSD